MKVSVTPLNIILMVAVCAGLIYTMTYVVRMILGADIPVIPDSYIENQVKKSFEAGKFNARVEDPKIEKNLFNPERKTQKRVALISIVSNAQIVLHGTFITPDLQTAYLEDIGNRPASGLGARQQQVLQKGDMISGFVLKEIYPTKVLLVRNHEKIFVQLTENKTVQDNTEKQPKSQKMQLPPKPPETVPQSDPLRKDSQ